MANDKPAGGWKHGAGGTPKPAAGPATSRKAWQPGAAAAKPAKQSNSRTGRFLLVGGFVAALIGIVVVIVLMWDPPKYPTLIVVAPNAQESLTWPENPAGAGTGDAFQAWKTEQPHGTKLIANREKTAAAGEWKKALDPKAESVVLYFASLVGVDSTGPYVWEVDPGATAPSDSHKLYVRDILKALEGHPPGQPKLVVFDPPGQPVSWVHGGIARDFPRALKELDADIRKDTGLSVACSHDTDQRAWTSEQTGRTVFGQVFLDGVQGGGGGQAGTAITGASLLPYLKQEVEKWAIVNRDEKQTPILLPSDAGAERAAKVTLGSVPDAAFTAQATPASTPVPAALGEAWVVAETLANRSPAPDTTDPARWREFLELLLRWERLIRLPGINTATIGAKVKVLGDQLLTASATVAHLPTALPAGRAFGHAVAVIKPGEFDALWGAPNTNARAGEWNAQRNRPSTDSDTARRMAWTGAVLDRLLDEGPSAKNLKVADELLALVDGTVEGRSVEGHFVRMLNQHLDADDAKRPNAELLKRAIRLRRTAEEVAWVGGLPAGADPHAEQIFRRTWGIVEQADGFRRLGEDCLFATDAKAFADAEGNFAQAEAGYSVARQTAKTVATALGFRDRAFARLPFFARWLGDYRGKMAAADLEALIAGFERAAKSAHTIGQLEGAPEATLADFEREARDGAAAFDAIAKALEVEAKALTNTVHPSNWHALDGVLSVPFLPAELRSQRLTYVRSVSAGLAPNPNQATGIQVPAAPARELSERQGRLALAIIGDDIAEPKQKLMQPKEGAWWESHRQVGDWIGKRFLSCRTSVKAALEKGNAGPLAEGIPHWASASKSARLASASAPLAPADAALQTEQSYWRHTFLLWQSHRITDDGWADAGIQTVDKWFCRKAAKILVAEAKQLAGANEANLSPDEIKRRAAACAVEEAYQPVLLDVKATPERIIADEATWDAKLTVVPTAGRKIGYPLYSLGVPGAPYHRPNGELNGRKRIEEFAARGAAQFEREFRFQSGPRTDAPSAVGKLRSGVFYRGHTYDAETKVLLAGAPSLEWNYTPPKGRAAFAILADKELVTGAVTLLLDITNSMGTEIEVDGKKTDRITEAKKAFEELLKQIPKGTTVTIASFYGQGDAIKVDPVCEPFELDRSPTQRDKMMDLVNAVTLASRTADTPLAGAVREVLNADRGKKFWPKSFSGMRSLIVLTDGEDNWADKDAYKGKTPAQVMIGALKGTGDDVEAHIVFFGIGDSAEGKRAMEQFKSVELPEQFRDPQRTPARLYKGIRNSAAFASTFKDAVLPRVNYLGDSQQRTLGVTLAGEAVYRTTDPHLAPGVYELFGLGTPQKLQLFPGDRVLLGARSEKNNLKLSIPAATYNLPDRAEYNRVVRSDDGPMLLSIPKFAFGDETTTSRGLAMLATLEPRPDARTQELLRAPRPLFAWFDVNYADGKEASANLMPRVRIENRPGTISPTWSIELFDWDRNRGGADAIRKPAVNGYWMDGLPLPLTTYAVDLKNLAQSTANARKQASDNGLSVELVELAIETVGPSKYLTVRLRYAKPGEPVFLRPGGWKDKDAKLVVPGERHSYYDAHSRYTARFGPLAPDDFDTTQKLELFSVATLRDHARQAGRAAKLAFPDRTLEAYDYTHRITLTEPKE